MCKCLLILWCVGRVLFGGPLSGGDEEALIAEPQTEIVTAVTEAPIDGEPELPGDAALEMEGNMDITPEDASASAGSSGTSQMQDQVENQVSEQGFIEEADVQPQYSIEDWDEDGEVVNLEVADAEDVYVQEDTVIVAH